jgi:O-antigen ligase
MRRLMPVGLGLIFAIVPLFPTFIALTGVAYPGVLLLPRDLVVGTLAACGVLAVYALITLARFPQAGAQPLLLPLLAVLGAGVLAGCVGFDPAAGLLFTAIGGLGIVWHCSVVRFYADRNAALAIYWCYLLSGALACAAAIAMVATRFPATQYAIAHGRATGTFILPGELAGYLIVFLPIAYALGKAGAQRALRSTAWAALALGAVTLALTYSRAGWMGLAAAFAFLLAIRTRRGWGAAALAVLGGAVAVLLLFNAHHDPSEDYTRLSIWQAAMQIADRFPLTGVGPFNFSRLYAIVRAPDADATAFHAHSLYLTFLVEFGIVGLACVVWTLTKFGTELRRRVAVAGGAQALLSLSIAAGLIGVAVQGLIDTVTVVIFGLWMPMMGLALAAARGGEPSPTIEA